MLPLSPENQREYGGEADRKFQGWGMLQSLETTCESEPGEHKNQGEAATPPGVGQGRTQRVTKSILAWAKDPG